MKNFLQLSGQRDEDTCRFGCSSIRFRHDRSDRRSQSEKASRMDLTGTFKSQVSSSLWESLMIIHNSAFTQQSQSKHLGVFCKNLEFLCSDSYDLEIQPIHCKCSINHFSRPKPPNAPSLTVRLLVSGSGSGTYYTN
jgi:hypothetical protein